MKNLWWNNETDTIETDETLKESYSLFGNEYDSFSDYVSACQWYNNGALTPLFNRINKLKGDLVRYADFYDSTEIDSIREEIATFEKMYMEV